MKRFPQPQVYSKIANIAYKVRLFKTAFIMTANHGCARLGIGATMKTIYGQYCLNGKPKFFDPSIAIF